MAFNKTDRPDGAKMRRPGGMRRRKKKFVYSVEIRTEPLIIRMLTS